MTETLLCYRDYDHNTNILIDDDYVDSIKLFVKTFIHRDNDPHLIVRNVSEENVMYSYGSIYQENKEMIEQEGYEWSYLEDSDYKSLNAEELLELKRAIFRLCKYYEIESFYWNDENLLDDESIFEDRDVNF